MILGTATPQNSSIFCNFSSESLEKTFHFFFNVGSNEFSKLRWSNNTDNIDAKTIDWSTPQSYDHLLMHSVFWHEQYHLRHVNASPLGLLIALCYAVSFAESTELLKEWAVKIKSHNTTPILPLTENHKSDVDIDYLRRIRFFGQAPFLLLYGDYNVSNKIMINELLLKTNKLISTSCRALFGRTFEYPEVKHKFTTEMRSINPHNITGRSVIEGLARMSEYMHIIKEFNPPIDIINRYFLHNAHSEYQIANSHVCKVLGRNDIATFLPTALFADWALQAPILPFLLDGRKEISAEEILPCSRFCLITDRFKKFSFKIDDVIKRPEVIENAIFEDLGWETPTNIAKKTLKIKNLDITSIVLKEKIKNFKTGAELRIKYPFTLQGANTVLDTNFVCSGFVFYTDYKISSIGMLSQNETKRYFELLKFSLDTTLIDNLCESRTLNEAKLICNAFVHKIGKPSWDTFLLEKLESMFGIINAEQILTQSNRNHR